VYDQLKLISYTCTFKYIVLILIRTWCLGLKLVNKLIIVKYYPIRFVWLLHLANTKQQLMPRFLRYKCKL